MWPSIWWIPRKSSADPDGRERVDDERVEDGRDRAEPRAEVRDQLGDGDPRAEEERVRSRPAGSQPIVPSSQMPMPALAPMISDTSSWPFT